MQISRSWCNPAIVVVVALAVLALVVAPASAQEVARIKCSCACKGNTRAYCAYHNCACNPSSSARLQGLTIATEAGSVNLALPPDIGAGDTISGTVFIEPPEGQESTEGVLEGYVLETPNEKHKLGDPKKLLKFLVPTAGIVHFILRDPDGNEVGRGETRQPESGPIEDVAYPEGPPSGVKRGDGFQVGGEYDGDAENTSASLGGTPLEVIAESPRGVYFEPTEPITGSGPMDLEIQEAGQTREYSMNVMDISLAADDLALRQGQRTQVHTTINGADGIGEGECYVVLTMAEGGAARFVGTRGGTITHPVDPDSVSPDGSYTFDTAVVGTNPGGFTINATLCAGNEKTFTFPNTGRRARASNDLHIEWSRGVTVKQDQPFGTTSGSGTSRTDHADGNVPVNGSGSVTVDWNGTMPKVKRWWYTIDGRRSGPIHTGNP